MAHTDKLGYHPSPEPGLGLTHPNIYAIQDLLELVKGPVLWNDNHRMPMTWGGLRIYQRSFGKVTVCQKPEALNQTNGSLQ